MGNVLRALALAFVTAVVAVAPASAGVPHTVQPGETLWTIAAANNFTTRALAAANGLSEDSQVVLGSTITIPSEAEVAAALAAQAAPTAGSAASAAPPPMGAYTVRPGDSLSAIAATAGVSLEQIAFMNGLDPARPLLVGTVLKLPTGAHGPSSAEPVPAQTVVPHAEPNPTPERVSSSQVAQVAAEHGVPAGLASAIAWQESGFNNALVSSANARGVMQIMPGTWEWVNQNLNGGNRLNPNSALENVHGGVLYLRQLLNDFGGDETAAAAAYYQGAAAVRDRGLYPETQQYVNSVNALRARFGG